MLTKKFKEFVEDIDPIIPDVYMVGYRTTDEEEVRIPLEVVSSGGLRKYLRKDIEDAAEEKIEFKKGLRSGGDTGSIQYIQGLLGWYGDKNGNFEMNSLVLRDFLEVPELRKNKITVMGNEFWFTDSATVMEVKELGSKRYEVLFKLEENEFISFRSSDILRGIFHYTNGFYTVVLHVYEVIYDAATHGAIGVRVESMNDKAPEKAMLLARMNNSADIRRQGSMYADGLNGYLRVLNGYKPSNPESLGDYDTMKLQLGNLNGLKGHPVFGDLEGYGLYASNVYLTGRFMQRSWEGTEEQPMFYWQGEYNNLKKYYPFDLIRFSKKDGTEATYYLVLNETTKAGIIGVNPEDPKPVDTPDSDFPFWEIYNNSGSAGLSLYACYNSSETKPNKPTGSGTTDGWSHDPVEQTVWMSQKTSSGYMDGEWSEPIKIKGNVGIDGEGNEFIFKLVNSSVTPAAPNDDYETNGNSQSTTGKHYQETGYVPDKLGWTDNPTEVTVDNKYLYVAKRFKRYDTANKVSKWGQYSKPTLFSIFAEDGAPGQDGAPGIPGTDGAPAKSVEIVGESLFNKPKGFTDYVPATITLSTVIRNTSETGKWQYRFNNTWVDSTDTKQLIVTPDNEYFVNGLLTIRYFINKNLYDIHSITKVQDGNDGAPGKDGSSVRILGEKASVNDLPMTGNVQGDGWLVQGDLYVWSGTEWIDAGRIQGPKGDQGIPGTPGVDGRTSYLHIKYSDDGKIFTPGSGGKDPGETPGKWLGQYTDYDPIDSLVFDDYSWSKIAGDDAYTIALSNDNSTIHCNENGFPYVGELGNNVTSSKVKTKVVMYKGGTKLKPVITYATSAGITVGLSVDTIFVKSVDIGFEHGFVDITTSADGLSLTRRFNVKIVRDGTTGPSIAYYGEWVDTTQYYCRDHVRTVVKVTDAKGLVAYWMSKLPSELEPGVSPEIPLITPPAQTTTHWTPFSAQFESIATGVLLAENATIDILESNAIYVGLNKTSNNTDATGWKLSESSIKSLRTNAAGIPLTEFTTDGQMNVQRGKIGNWSITNNGLIFIDAENHEQAGFKPNTTTGFNSNLLLYTNYDEGRYGAPYAFYVTNDGLLSTERLETNSLKIDNGFDVGNWAITKDTILSRGVGNIVLANGLVTTEKTKSFNDIAVSDSDTKYADTKTYTYDAFYGTSLREYVVDTPTLDFPISITSGKTVYIYAQYKHYKTTDTSSNYWYDRSDFGSLVRAYFTDGTSEDIAVNKFVFTIPYRHRNEGMLSNFSYKIPTGKTLRMLRVVIKNKMKSHAKTTWNTTANVNLKVFGSSANAEWQIGNNGFYFKKGTDSYIYSDIQGDHILRAKGRMIFESNSGGASIILEDDNVYISGNPGAVPGSIATTGWVKEYTTWTNVSSKPAWIGPNKPTYTASEVGALGANSAAVDSLKLGGADAARFLKDNGTIAQTNLNSATETGIYNVTNGGDMYRMLLVFNNYSGTHSNAIQFWGGYGENNIKYRIRNGSGNTWDDWKTIWHSQNSNLNTVDWTTKHLFMNGNVFLRSNNSILGKDDLTILKDHGNGNVTLSACAGDLYMGYTNTNNLRFYTGGAIKAILNSDGCMGIGLETGISASLHIAGTSGRWMQLLRQSNASTNNSHGLLIDAGTSLSDFPLRIRNQATNELFCVTGNGCVGVGFTNPTIRFAIGDNDTGFNWTSDGNVKGVANGVNVFGWYNNIFYSHSHLIVGSGGDAELRTRHVSGKHYQNDSDSELYLNWRSKLGVHVGGGQTVYGNLLVKGETAGYTQDALIFN